MFKATVFLALVALVAADYDGEYCAYQGSTCESSAFDESLCNTVKNYGFTAWNTQSSTPINGVDYGVINDNCASTGCFNYKIFTLDNSCGVSFAGDCRSSSNIAPGSTGYVIGRCTSTGNNSAVKAWVTWVIVVCVVFFLCCVCLPIVVCFWMGMACFAAGNAAKNNNGAV
jgi:hypothetical protein